MRFHTVERDEYRRTQSCGVVVKSEHKGEDIDFYGLVQDILELRYCGKCIYIFKCDWWDVGNKKDGIKTDGGLVSVNFDKKWYTNDPFILAIQAEQVFYVNDMKNGANWRIIQRIHPRNSFDIPDEIEDISCNDEPYQETQTNKATEVEQIDDHSIEPLNRNDVSPHILDWTAIQADVDDYANNEDDTIYDYESEGNVYEDDNSDPDVEDNNNNDEDEEDW